MTRKSAAPKNAGPKAEPKKSSTPAAAPAEPSNPTGENGSDQTPPDSTASPEAITPTGEVHMLSEREYPDGTVVCVLMDDTRVWKEVDAK